MKDFRCHSVRKVQTGFGYCYRRNSLKNHSFHLYSNFLPLNQRPQNPNQDFVETLKNLLSKAYHKQKMSESEVDFNKFEPF